jgi:hypothetical protein
MIFSVHRHRNILMQDDFIPPRGESSLSYVSNTICTCFLLTHQAAMHFSVPPPYPLLFTLSISRRFYSSASGDSLDLMKKNHYPFNTSLQHKRYDLLAINRLRSMHSKVKVRCKVVMSKAKYFRGLNKLFYYKRNLTPCSPTFT